MRINNYLWALFLFTVGATFGQTQEVTGVITDASTNMPLMGASILVKNTHTGTITDFDGDFTIQAEPNDVLVISYLGYKTEEVQVGNQTNFEISLSLDAASIEQVVVVGYGTKNRSEVTGAIASVDATELESLPISDVGEVLQGRTTGVTIAAGSGQPGSGSTIRIRGVTSLNNNSPLWIVDGVVVDNGGINYLNPSDIKSVEVLKDAASQAIYGARGASGVILVSTKEGKKGKIKVNFNTYFGISNPSKKLDLLNATQYAILQNEASLNDGGQPIFANPESLGVGTDWQDEIFTNSAMTQSHQVSVSGGGDASTFYLSFSYLEEEGIVATEISNYERYSIRLNSTHEIADWLEFGENLGISREKSLGLGNTNSEFGGPLSSVINLDPITPVVVTDPTVLTEYPYNQDLPLILAPNGNPYGVSQYVGQEMTNPLAYIQTRLGNYGYSDNLIGNAYLQAEPIEGLKLRSSIGAKLSYWGGESYTPIFFLNTSTTSAQTSFNRYTNHKLDYNMENTISYSKEISKHDLTVLFGQAFYKDNMAVGLSVTKYGIPADNFEEASLNFDVPTTDVLSSGYENVAHNISSLFGRITYNFDKKYLFNGIIRRDGSSRFGENNKYGIFPSASIGWVASREDFLNNDVINFLKIRGSYGVVGNDNIGDLAYLATIGSGRNYAFGDQNTVYDVGYSPNAPANPDLKWEETTQLNIGFDARFLNGFSMTFDWYKKVTDDILQYPRIPAYVGVIGSPAKNVGSMENRGVELSLGYSKTYGDFSFSINANASYLENEVTYLGNELEFLNGGVGFQASSYPITRTAVGHPVNSFFGFKTLGVFQTTEEINNYTGPSGELIQPNAVPGDFRWQDTNGDGNISQEDRVFLGSGIPNWSYGISINANYKNFDLAIFGQGVAGNKIFQGLRRLDINNANYQTAALGRWTGPGTSNTFPRVTNADPNHNFSYPSDFYLEDGDYFRLKTVQLGYSIPESIISHVGLTKARIYLMGENLLTLTNYTGYDPEIGGGVMSIDKGIYPQPRTYMIGASLSF